MKFEDVFKKISGMTAEDRDAILAISSKYPDLDNAIVGRDEFAQLETRATEFKTTADKWLDWAYGPVDAVTKQRTGGNWNREHNMTNAQWEAEQTLLTEKSRIAEMEAAGIGTGVGGGDVDFDQVKKFITEQGYVKATDVAGLAKVEDVDKKLNTHGGNMEYIFTHTVHLPMRFHQEFGSADPKAKFDMDAFIRFITSDPTGERVKDTDKAFDEFVAPKRMELREAKLKADEAALEVAKQELEAKRTAAPSPTDDGTGNIIPPFQREVQGLDKDAKKFGENVPFGTGVLGNDLYRAYKSGELSTGKPN